MVGLENKPGTKVMPERASEDPGCGVFPPAMAGREGLPPRQVLRLRLLLWITTIPTFSPGSCVASDNKREKKTEPERKT